MPIKCLFLGFLLSLFMSNSALAYSKEWKFDVPSKEFPSFFSSDERVDFLLNDFFARHWFAIPGPTPYTGNQQTLWREWDSLNTAWVDTSRSKAHEHDYKQDLKKFFLEIEMDDQGYVYTYPPDSGYRNNLGWPFPDYTHSDGRATGWDWDVQARTEDGWTISKGNTMEIKDNVWRFRISRGGYIESPGCKIEAFQSPYIIVQIASKISGDWKLEWQTEADPTWNKEKSYPFSAEDSEGFHDYYVPVWRNQTWRGNIVRLRLSPPEAITSDGVEVKLHRVHCAYDTRHAINNTNYILGAWRYYLWTGDDDFLKRDMDRIRRAAHFLRHYLQGDKEGIVILDWWGHDGTSGIKPMHIGYGMGSDYYDILPMGYKTAITNTYYIASLKAMAELENIAEKRRDLGVPKNPFGEDAESFRKQADRAAKTASKTFWDDDKGRFIGCIDAEGVSHDYGFIVANEEAMFYGMAGDEQANKILEWIDGERIIEGDTSTGKDIWRWRIAPRVSTKRNIEWYIFVWYAPESIPWGYQIQDGGTVAYLSFYDIMNRLKYKDPEDAWSHLANILDWYEEVWNEGGYRKYYTKKDRGTLQGGGPPGGIGIDREFTETTLVPLTMLYGFMGIDARPEGLVIQPRLPKDLEYAGIKKLCYRGAIFTIKVTNSSIEIECMENPNNLAFMFDGKKLDGCFKIQKDIDKGKRAILIPQR